MPTMIDSIFLILLVAILASLTEAQVGLLIRRRWRNYTSPISADPCRASSCATRVEEGCVPQHRLSIENFCYHESPADISYIKGSSRIFPLNDTHYCDKDFDDSDCISPSEGDATTCESPRAYQQCTDEDTTVIDIFYLPDFCLESTTPEGEYVIAMFEQRVYGNASNCQAEDSDIYLQSFLPHEPACLPGTAVVDDTRELRSSSWTCDSEGRTIISRYTDAECSSQNGTYYFPPTPTLMVDGCTPVEKVPGDIYNMEYNWTQRPVCSSPRYYCKDFSELDFFGLTPSIPSGNLDDDLSLAPLTSPGYYFLGVMISLLLVDFFQ